VEKLVADHGFSERRACRLIGVNRSAWQYEPLRGQDDGVRLRMREIANERRRFGYRRLAILLEREGKGMNLKKVYRLYRAERLTVRKRGGRKRALGTRAPMRSRRSRTSDGRSTSCLMRWPAAGGSGC
jgi:putative transposase